MGQSWAQTANGGTISPFSLGGSARALGMGNSGVAITGDGDGFFENPAVLATLDEHEILTFHAPLYIDTLYDSLGYFNPVSAHNSFGLAVARLGVSNILQTQNNIQALSTFSSEQWQGLLGYGFRPLDDLDFGGTVKYEYEQLAGYQGSGVGLDLGMLYHFSRNRGDFSQLGYKNITLGLSVSNALQPQTKLFQDPSVPLRVYRPGFSYLFEFPSSKNVLWLTVEGEVPETGGNTLVKGGVEFGWNQTVFARAGYDGISPTAGAGIRLSDFELDYAFNQRDLGALHRFSLSYHFGRYMDPFQDQKLGLLKSVARGYTANNDYDPAIRAWQDVLKEFPEDGEASHNLQDLQKKRKNAVQDQLQLARSALSRGDVERALPYIAKVLSLDPGNPSAKELLKQIDRKTLLSTNYTRGVEAYSQENFELAVQYLGMVYDVDPTYRDVARLYHDAQSYYQPLQTMPKELTALYAKGVDYYMNGDYQKAIDTWEGLLEKNPKNFLLRRNIEEARNHLKDKPVPGATAPSNPGTGGKP
ncbi:MAG TPA: PorV/PorQ family protein [bacterium]|nr:PorV/PorQ family protein [bacterium]